MKARDNPLTTHRVLTVRYRPLDMSWAELLNRLDAMNYRAAVVGPKGSGKTTLIEDLVPHLVARGLTPRLIRLSAECRVFDPALLRDLTERDLVLLDGAEQQGTLRWMRFHRVTRRAAGLIITLHHPGRLPTLLQTATTPQLLQQITSELLGSHAPPPARMEQLYACHGGNLREALRELYDDFAVMPS